ncbi:hypothetical protein BGZ58_001000, partial [Dissophora ornata]
MDNTPPPPPPPDNRPQSPIDLDREDVDMEETPDQSSLEGTPAQHTMAESFRERAIQLHEDFGTSVANYLHEISKLDNVKGPEVTAKLRELHQDHQALTERLNIKKEGLLPMLRMLKITDIFDEEPKAQTKRQDSDKSSITAPLNFAMCRESRLGKARLDDLSKDRTGQGRIGTGRRIKVCGCDTEALKTNSTLINLNLAVNSIGDNGAVAPSEALKTNSTLTTLHLSNNSIRSKGAQALSEALKTNSTPITSNLHCNRIGDNGAQAL